MEITKTPIDGLLIIKPKVFADPRGYFLESFRLDLLEKNGFTGRFVQDNESRSNAGVLRGLHFQNPPHAQAKLIRAVTGRIFDVVVDIRKNSATYGQSFGVELSAENKWSFFIPAGFAHGFCALEDNTVIQYKCTDYYHPETEGSVAWNDPDLNIKWPVENPLLSEKDKNAPSFQSLESRF